MMIMLTGDFMFKFKQLEKDAFISVNLELTNSFIENLSIEDNQKISLKIIKY